MEHAWAERVVNELPGCRPTKKRRDGARAKERRASRGRARFACAICTSCHSRRMAFALCGRACGGESREATTKSGLTDGLSGRNPRRAIGRHAACWSFAAGPPWQRGNRMVGRPAPTLVRQGLFHQAGAVWMTIGVRLEFCSTSCSFHAGRRCRRDLWFTSCAMGQRCVLLFPCRSGPATCLAL